MIRTTTVDHNQYKRLNFTIDYKTYQNDIVVYKYTVTFYLKII